MGLWNFLSKPETAEFFRKTVDVLKETTDRLEKIQVQKAERLKDYRERYTNRTDDELMAELNKQKDNEKQTVIKMILEERTRPYRDKYARLNIEDLVNEYNRQKHDERKQIVIRRLFQERGYEIEVDSDGKNKLVSISVQAKI